MSALAKVLVVALSSVAFQLCGARADAACIGDCGGDGEVTVDEIVLGVSIALGGASAASCMGLDANGDGEVTINEIISAVSGALNGCPAAVATPTATATPTQSTPSPTPACVADGVAMLSATTASPSSGQGAVAGSCVTVENAGGTRTELTRVSIRGTVNTHELLIQIYFVTATGEIEAVSYGWVPFPGIPDFYENLAFCNAPGCHGITVSLQTRTVRVNGTAVAGEAGVAAVLNGTITLDHIPQVEATPTPSCRGGAVSLTITDIVGTTPGDPLPATLELGMATSFSHPANPPVPATLSALYDGCPMPFPRHALGFSFSAEAFVAASTHTVGSFQGAINQIELRQEGFGAAKAWKASSGELVVDSLVDDIVHFRIVNARMVYQDIGPARTFLLNATGRLE